MVNNNVPVPQLANPLPPLKTDIVIPMDQNNYNALLSQMYPQYTSNTYVNNNPCSRHNYQPPVQGIYIFIHLCLYVLHYVLYMFCTVFGSQIVILVFILFISMHRWYQ